jgi:hypothetical protein
MNDYSIALECYLFVIWERGGNVPPLPGLAHWQVKP